jgi:hypothetical protein
MIAYKHFTRMLREYDSLQELYKNHKILGQLPGFALTPSPSSPPSKVLVKLVLQHLFIRVYAIALSLVC